MSDESQLLVASDSGIQTVVPQLTAVSPQIVYLDFDGAETSYNGELLTIDNVVVEDSGFDDETITLIVEALNDQFGGDVVFTVELPQTDEFSTIYVGVTSAFEEYGNFLGLAETIDSGNQIHDDNAFVMLNSTASLDLVTSVIAHETEHVVSGLEHDGDGFEKYAATSVVSSGQTAAGLVILSGTTVNVFGVVSSMRISSGRVYVSSGGTINSTTLNYYGNVVVYNGGVANEIVAGEGSVYIYSGGIANLTTVGAGYLYIENGGVANGVILNSYGWIRVSNGGIANSITLSSGAAFVFSGGTANNVTVASRWANVYLNSDAVISNVTVSSGGMLYVSNGGIVSNAMVSSGGSLVFKGLLLRDGASYSILDDSVKLPLSNVTVMGAADVSSGETASNIMVSNGSLFIASGAVANRTTINNGYVYVARGGIANSTIVNSCMVLSGLSILGAGIANNTVINNEGYVYVDVGGTANIVTVSSGGVLHISSGGIASNVVVSSGGRLVFQGILMDEAASYSVLDHNVKIPLSNVTITDDYLAISSGETACNVTISGGGGLTVSSGATANETTVNWGRLIVNSGGVVNSTSLSYGWMSVSQGGTANKTTVGGNIMMAELDIYVNGFVNSAVVISRGSMFVYSGGLAADISVSSGGSIYVSSGGIVSNVTVFAGGAVQGMIIGTDTTYALLDGNARLPLSNVTVSDASVSVLSGEIASNVTIKWRGSMTVSSGGVANATVINSGSMTVSSGGVANATVISSGSMIVSFGGSINSTMLSSGTIYISNGVTAKNTTIANTNYTSLTLLSGAVHSGTINVSRNGGFKVSSGGVINFSVNERTPDDDALINKWSYIAGIPTYTLMVAPDQAEGTYKLANDAEDFDDSITIYTTVGQRYDAISVGSSFCTDNVCYSLSLNNDILEFIVSSGSSGSSSVVTSGLVNVYSSGMLVLAGGYLTGQTLLSGGNDFMYVSAGGQANSTTVNAGGVLQTEEGAIMGRVVLSGGNYSGGGVFSGNTAMLSGGAILNLGGDAMISGASFVQNSAIGTGGSAYPCGGAIYNSGGSVLLTDVIFSGNVVSGAIYHYGGALYNKNGTVDVTSGKFFGNIGWEGGAVVNSNGTMNLANVSFTSHANGYGGAVSNTLGGTLSIVSATFQNNYAGNCGGAILNCGNMTVSATDFLNNSGRIGGVIFNANSGSAFLSSVTFSGNSDTYNGGGAIDNCGSMRLTDVDFLENKTLASGGAIYNSGTMTISGAVFSGNSASSQGGAIYNLGVATLRLNGEVTFATETDSIFNIGTIRIGTSATITTFATITTSAGTIVNNGCLVWNISERMPDSVVMVDDISRISGGTYSITVSADQIAGQYRIAGGAADFTGTISVKDTSSVNYGTLSVGGLLNHGDRNYSLVSSEGVLSLAVSSKTTVLPDLSFASNWYWGYGHNLGSPDVNLYVGVKNVGSASAGSSWVYFSMGGMTTSGYCGPLAPGQSTVVSASFTGLTVGSTYTAVITADGGRQVTESDETNNVGSMTVSMTDAHVKLFDVSGNIVSSGTAGMYFTSLTVASGYTLDVYSGGTASCTTVASGAVMNISSGGMALQTKENGGYVNVASGATATFVSNTISTLALSNNSATLHSGTTAVSATIAASGWLDVLSGGSVNTVAVNSGGSLSISSGANVQSVTLNYGCYFSFNIYAIIASVTLNSGVGYTMRSTRSNFVVNSGASVNVYSSGNLTSGLVNESGIMVVASGGVANSTTVVGGSMYASSGGTAVGTVVGSGGNLVAWSGGTANGATVGSSGWMVVLSNGLANSTMINAGGNMGIRVDGLASMTTVAGGAMHVSQGGIANTVVVNSGWLVVSSGGTVNQATINGGGLWIYDGGQANSATINAGAGIMVSSGGTANGMIVNAGGGIFVYNGGIANHVAVSSSGRMDVSSGGTANSAIVIYGGNMDVSSGASANDTLVSNYGGLYIYSGLASRTTVFNHGWLNVFEGGVVSNTVVSSGGSLIVGGSGMVTGSLTIAAGGIVSALSGSVINFDISSNLSTNSNYLMNNLSLISGVPSYTITVSSTQSLGTYQLAAGASNFTGTVSVRNTAGTSYGTLSVGGALNYGGRSYSLGVNNGILLLDVASAAVAPVKLYNASGSLVSSGTVFSNFTIPSAYHLDVNSGGTALNTVVASGARLFAYESGVLSGTVVSSGGVELVHPYGVSISTTVLSGGSQNVYGGAVASAMTINSGANLLLGSNANIRGNVRLAGTAIVSGAVNASSATVDFDVSRRSTTNTYIVNNLSLLSGASYSVTVSNTQALGTYKLAGGASNFTGTISVKNTEGTSYGTLTVGETVTNSGRDYTLLKGNSGDLSLMVKIADNIAPVISDMSIAQWSNGYTFTVTVSATDNVTPASELTYKIRYASSPAALSSPSTSTEISGTMNFTLPASDAGKTYYWCVGATDAAGNTGWSKAKYFTVKDVTKPVLSGVPSASFSDYAVVFSWDAASDNAGVIGYRLTVNGTVHDVQDTHFTLSDVSVGTYAYSLVAYDEAGNESLAAAGETLRVEERPDLVVTTIKVLKDGVPTTTVSTEDRITVYVGVRNVGDAAAPASTVRVYCGEVLLREVSLAAIAKNMTAVCTCTVEAGSMSTGVQDIHVMLDARESVAEYGEANNEQHFSLLVENRELCDLVVGALELDRTTCSPSDATKVMFTIRNIGYTAAGATKAYVYDGETLLGSVDVVALAAGATSSKLTYTIAAGRLSTGTHSIRVVADGEGTSMESNPENNSAAAVLTVGGADLVVSRLTLSKASCNTGESVTVGFTIQNGGVIDAGATKVAVYDGTTLLGRVDVGALAAGLSVSKEFVIAAGRLPAGSHTLRIVADADNAVAETDESNNARTAALSVTQLDVTVPSISRVNAVQEGYAFTVSVSATDNVTAASDIQYELRHAATQNGLDSAEWQAELFFSLDATKAGSAWYYQVSATDAAGNTAYRTASVTVADKTAPVFGDISVTTTNMTLGLDWSARDNVGVTSYKIYFDSALKNTQMGTTYSLANVGTGTHTYRIEAYDEAGNMASTGDTSVRFDDSVKPVLGTVTVSQSQGTYDFTVTASATDNVTSSDNIKYRLQYAFAQDSVSSATVTSAAVSPLSFTLNDADAGKTLYYRVQAIDEAGNDSGWSGIQSVTVRDFTAPGDVSGLAAAVNGTGVALGWDDATDNVKVTGYYLRYGRSQNLTGSGTAVTASQKTLSSLAAGTYYWQVAAADAAGNLGEWSSHGNFTILPADPYESNDTVATAYNLGVLSGETVKSGAAVASASDADWFKFTLNARGTANDYVQISFDNKVGDLDLYLYATNGTTLIKSAATTTASTEKISLEGLQKGTYLIKAVGKNGAMNTYTLSTKKVAGYDPDIYDANSPNDTMAAATVFNIETTPKNTVSGLNLHQVGDTDYYQFTLSNMGTTGDYVSISFEHIAGDLDLYLYDASGTQLQKSAGTSNSESLSFTGLAAGTYYVKVMSPQSAVNEYTLSWNFTPNRVDADRYEGHEPVAITETTKIENLTISAPGSGVTRADVFTITLGATGTASSKIAFSGYRSDWSGLKYTLKNGSGGTVLSGTGSEVSLNGLAAGNYSLTVDTPVEGSYGGYDVSVSLPENDDPKRAILVYVCGDNNGHNRYLYDIVTMQHARLNANVDVYVLFDRSGNYYNMQNCSYLGYSQWTDTRVCKLNYSTSWDDKQNWISWEEYNTGSISTLQRFIEYGMSESEADDYVLILKNHGDGFGGICVDQTSSNDRLYGYAVADLLSQYGNFSVVALDACLLGNEISVTAYEGSCDYVIASEASSYSLGYNIRYTEMLEGITADMSSKAVADVIISTSNHEASQIFYTSTGRRYTWGELEHTLAAFEVGQSGLSKALNAFGESSKSFSANDWKKLAKAFKAAQSYTDSDWSYQFSDFMTILNTIVNPSQVLSSAINAFINTYQTILVGNVAVPNTYGTGLAVFNPVLSSYNGLQIFKYYAQKTDLSSWVNFIGGLYNHASLADDIHVSDNMDSVLFIPSMGMQTLNLGIFSGKGIMYNNLNVISNTYYSLTFAEHSMGQASINVSSYGDNSLVMVLYDSDMNFIASSNNGTLSLSGLDEPSAPTDYVLMVSAGEETTFSLSFDAEWTTGVDRYDYALTMRNERFVNGNGSIEKAVFLANGTYSGLVTYKGDSDYYLIGSEVYDSIYVMILGTNLDVAEYDADGNLVQTAENVNGRYMMTMSSMNYLFIEGKADISQDKVDSYSISINATAPAPTNLVGTSESLSWSGSVRASGYVVEYSLDGFETVVMVETETAGLEHYNVGEGTWQWRVRNATGTEWAVGDDIVVASQETTPIVVSATEDDVKDAFFVKPLGTWDSTYRARHMGVNGVWEGTGEKVVFGGENRFGDIFQGSTDENVLLLTDDANGDALFIDDVYTASKNDLGKTQARLAQIKEIRAGAGNDIVDLTSDKFDYTGGGLTVRGGLGDDTIWANAGNNTLFGDAGNDRLVGAGGNDVIVGGNGDDSMHGGGGDDVFAFGGAWGKDTVEQLSGGKVTLWFDSGSAANWNASTLTYKDGDKSVKVSGIAASDVTLKFGDDDSEQYGKLLEAGAFDEFSNERIFENRNTRGMLA